MPANGRVLPNIAVGEFFNRTDFGFRSGFELIHQVDGEHNQSMGWMLESVHLAAFTVLYAQCQ